MNTIEIYINKIDDNEWEKIKEKLASYIIGTKTNNSARVLVVPAKEVEWVLQIITNLIKVSDIELRKCDE